MAKNVQGARVLIKRSEITGEIPTIPLNQDHTTGWASTDIYTGEFFINLADDRAWIRTDRAEPVELVLLNYAVGGGQYRIDPTLIAMPINNPLDYRLLTANTGNDTIDAEAKLLFDGSTLTINGNINAEDETSNKWFIVDSDTTKTIKLGDIDATNAGTYLEITDTGVFRFYSGDIYVPNMSNSGTTQIVYYDVATGKLSYSDLIVDGVDNNVITSTGSNNFQGENNLTFDGSILAIQDSITLTSSDLAKVSPIFNGTQTKQNKIAFIAKSGSLQDGEINYESSSFTGDLLKSTIHLVTGVANSNTDNYVSIHGSAGTESIKLYTGGHINTVGTIYSIGNITTQGDLIALDDAFITGVMTSDGVISTGDITTTTNIESTGSVTVGTDLFVSNIPTGTTTEVIYYDTGKLIRGILPTIPTVAVTTFSNQIQGSLVSVSGPGAIAGEALITYNPTTGLTISSGSVFFETITTGTTSDIIYYDSVTGEITYNSAPSAPTLQVVTTAGSTTSVYSTFTGSAGSSSDTRTRYGFEAGLGNSSNAEWTAIGSGAAKLNTSGDGFTAIGTNAGMNNIGGYWWTAVGFNAGLSCTSNEFTAIGHDAGKNNISGNQWVAIGESAAEDSTSSLFVAIGYRAGINNTSGSKWVSIGQAAGGGDGNNYITIGSGAAVQVSGDDFVAIGPGVLDRTSLGGVPTTNLDNGLYLGAYVKCYDNGVTNENVIGYAAEGKGSNTVVIGNSGITANYFYGNMYVDTLDSATTANVVYYDSGTGKMTYGAAPSGGGGTLQEVTASGATTTIFSTFDGGISSSSGQTTRFGFEAIIVPTSAISITAFGYHAAREVTDGRDGVAMGANAADSVTSGDYWTAVGSDAASSNSTGDNWTAVGSAAARSATGNRFVAVGSVAGDFNTSGDDWTAIGYRAGYRNATGSDWVSIGSYAAQDALSSGFVAIGKSAATNVDSGSNWIAIGEDCAATYVSTAFAESFSNGIYIGNDVRVSGAGASNEIAIGYIAEGKGSNTVVIGNTGITATYLQGDVYVDTLASATTANVVYYDSGTGKMTYGAASSGGTTISNPDSGHILLSDGTSTGIDASTKLSVEFESVRYITSTNASTAFEVQNTDEVGVNAAAIVEAVTSNSARIIMWSYGVSNDETMAGFDMKKGNMLDFQCPSASESMVRVESGSTLKYIFGTGSSTAHYKFAMTSGGTFHADGDVVANSTTTTSDRRLKKNIIELTNSLDVVKQLRGVTYEWIDKEDGAHYGYIAQEVEELMPEAVVEHSLEVRMHGDTTPYKTIRYNEIIPVLSEAIKEQQVIIDSQKETIDKLSGKLDTIFKEIELLKK